MFCTQPIYPLARKKHKCCNCGEFIIPGEEYVKWTSFDGSASTNKMHHECYDALSKDAAGREWEYDLYGGERPR
jgi:hypothetical protein